MKKLIAALILASTAFSSDARANDYSMATNAVMKGRVPWRVAIFLIDTTIDGLERYPAVASLVKYQSRGLIPHLKTYAGDPSIRTATFWPLYKNGEKEFAMNLLKEDIANGNAGAASIFYSPNYVGSEYKLDLTKNDPEFRTFVLTVAKDKTADPQIRIYAAIHLAQIGMKAEALAVANDILKLTKERSHIQKMAEWCVKLAKA